MRDPALFTMINCCSQNYANNKYQTLDQNGLSIIFVVCYPADATSSFYFPLMSFFIMFIQNIDCEAMEAVLTRTTNQCLEQNKKK